MAPQSKPRWGANCVYYPFARCRKAFASVPTFAHYLRVLGYRTVLAGKMHFVGPDQLHGFEERRTTDIYPADFGWTPDWLQPDERVDWWFHNMDAVTQAGVAEVTNQLLFDDEVGHQGVRALHDLAVAGGVFVVLVAFWFVVTQLARQAREIHPVSPSQPGMR